MVPAKTRCPSTWTLEYSGYLLSQYNTNITPCMSVLTRTQTQYLGVLPTLCQEIIGIESENLLKTI